LPSNDKLAVPAPAMITAGPSPQWTMRRCSSVSSSGRAMTWLVIAGLR
jgi:hypothetical protein